MANPRQIHRFESMLFNNETTLKIDFDNGEIKPIDKTVYKEKPSCLRIRPPPLKDHHSLSDWRVPNVPFALYDKDFVNKDPWKIQKPYHKLPDLEREHVQKTRPRIVMAPFVSMDDLQDPEVREHLTNDFYTSEMTRSTRKILEVTPHSVRAPFPTGLPAPANPILLPKLKEPYVSPEWRMDSVFEDRKALRSHCGPTKEFWLGRPLSKCKPCEQSAIAHAHRTMK